MQPLLVSCLTATHGRHKVLQEAVSCFMEQDYPYKELIILNNHHEPLQCDLEGVRVYNEPKYATLGDCRNRLLELADGEYIRTWDDDDLYLPWAISQGVENIGSYDAFKPVYSWYYDGSKYSLAQNVMEASITFRKEFVKKHGYQATGGDEHNPIMLALQQGGCLLLDVRPSYCYRVGIGLHRISGSLGSDTVENRTKAWMDRNRDVGDGVIRKVDVSKYFEEIHLAENGIT